MLFRYLEIQTSLEAYVKKVKIVKIILPKKFLGRRRGHYESREGSGDGESYGVWAVNQSKQPWRESFYNRVEAAEEVHATGQYQVPSIDEGWTVPFSQYKYYNGVHDFRPFRGPRSWVREPWSLSVGRSRCPNG